MIDSFDDVPAFVAVVEMGGFSAAAKRLNLSRSATSKAVARLEQRLNVRLFQRTTRSLGLTDEGQVFFERCDRAMAELRVGKALLESGRLIASGKLRISMPVLFGRMKVAPILLRLAEAHPALELELDFHDRLVDLVNDGFDLCVRNGPTGNAAGLMVRRIAREEMVVCASPSYLARHGAPGGPADLSGHKAIVYTRNGRTQIWRFPRGKLTPAEVSPPTRLRLDDLGAILDAAVAGYGLAWLPNWLIAENLQIGALVPLCSRTPALTSDICALWPEAPYLPVRVRVAINALVEETPS